MGGGSKRKELQTEEAPATEKRVKDQRLTAERGNEMLERRGFYLRGHLIIHIPANRTSERWVEMNASVS